MSMNVLEPFVSDRFADGTFESSRFLEVSCPNTTINKDVTLKVFEDRLERRSVGERLGQGQKCEEGKERLKIEKNESLV